MVHTKLEDHVAVVTIDRQERRNALDLVTLEKLAGVLDGFGSDVRVVVLRGAGGHFCAGADLSGVEDEAFVDLLKQVLVRLTEAPYVAIAGVEGVALGAGTQLAVACDLRVATAGASFGIPAAKLGLAVDGWTVERLATLAGHGPARAMLLAAEVLTGERLHGLGLVQRLGDPEDAVAWAREVAALAPLTIQAHKMALAAPDGRAEEAVERAWQSEDLQEGLAAFGERRPAHFLGR